MDEWIAAQDTLLHEARSCVRSDRREYGFRQYAHALDRAREHGDPGYLVRTLMEYGSQLVIFGELAQGLLLIDEAEFTAIETGVLLDQGALEMVHAKVCAAQGDRDVAAQCYRRAADEFQAVGRTAEYELAMSSYAFEIEHQGDPSRSIAAHHEAIGAYGGVGERDEQRDQRLGLHIECIALNYTAMRDFRTALIAFRRAREHWEDLGADIDVARCELGLGDVYSRLGKAEPARDCFQRALRSFLNHSDFEAVAAIHVLIRGLDGPERATGPSFS